MSTRNSQKLAVFHNMPKERLWHRKKRLFLIDSRGQLVRAAQRLLRFLLMDLEWIEKVQLCVHDEAQQFGNLDEVAALARLPPSCLCIWTGDHKQTSGGLKKTEEAKTFRKKIMKRPLGLRSGSTFHQPHHLMALLTQIAETSPDTMAHSIMQLSADQARRRPTCILELERVLKAPVSPAMLDCSVKRAALAVLWASFHFLGVGSYSCRHDW